MPAFVGNPGNIERGSRAIEIGLGLLKLLIQLRRFDFRQQLSLLDACADVDMPRFEVTVGAGMDRGICERLRIAGQHDFLGRRTERGMHDGDRWNGRGLGLRGQSCLGVHARSDAAVNDKAD